MNPYSPPAAYAPPYAANQPYGTGATSAVSERAIELLRQTRPWVVFLAILAFLGSGFMLVAGLALTAVGFASKGERLGGLIGLAYVPIALIYLYPAIKMWTYGSAISRLAVSRGTADLEAALAQQKSLWKFLGIAVIVMFVVYLGIFGVFAAMAVGSKLH